MSELNTKIRDIFSLWQRDVCPGGQVLVRKDGQIIFDQCFGYADLERRVKVTPDTIFHVASVSKQITTLSILLLRERGLLDIDADIRTYIPDLVAFKEPVTVVDMMRNISGIRDQWELQMFSGVRMNDVIVQSDLLYLNARQRSLNFPPRSKYLYSNTNFTFLSEIVHRVSGLTLNDFAREHIFVPLKMDKTFIRARYDDLVDNRALSYIDNGDGTFRWKPLNFSNNGATSLHTTAGDFMKWLAHFENPTLCSQLTLDIMQAAPTLTGGALSDYACGLMLDNKSGHPSIGHGGADAGYRSHVLHFPQDKLDIVVFSNTENIPMGQAAFKIADAVLGTDSFPGHSPLFSPEETDPVLGDFCPQEVAMHFGIYKEDGRLMLKMGAKTVPLLHEAGNRYGAGYLAEKVYFRDSVPHLDVLGTHMPMRPLQPANFTEAQLTQLAGTYYSDEIEAVYTLDISDGKAVLRHKRYGTAEIFKVGADEYFCPLEHPLLFQLMTDAQGTICGLTLKGGRVLALDLHKVTIC